MKRLLCFILTSLLVLSLCACGGGKSDGKTEAETDVSETASIGSTEDINLADGYSLVRPENDSSVAALGTDIVKAFRDTVKLTNGDDSGEPTGKEIIIGNTNRSETAEAKKYLRENGGGHENDYIICCINGNIVIFGVTADSLNVAVEKFIEQFSTKTTIKGDTLIMFADDSKPDIKIDGVSINKYDIIIPKYNMSYYAMRKLEDLKNYVRETSGLLLNVVKDDTAPTEYEIIVGECKRDGVKMLGTEEYEVRKEGKKVYLGGGKNYSLAYAIDKFVDMVKKSNDVAVTNASGTYVNGEKAGDYKLVWSDDFDTLDANKWNIRNVNHGNNDRISGSGYGSWYGMSTARSNRPENVSVRDGNLYITATFDSETFYGGWLDTSKSMTFVGGYMEISARGADGPGLWYDFWTWCDEQEHLEFDIMECPGPGEYYQGTLHQFVRENGKQVDISGGTSVVTADEIYFDEAKDRYLANYKYGTSKSLNADYHTYGAEWTDTEAIFYRDGEVTLRYNYTESETARLYSVPHYFILSMLVGSNYNNIKNKEELKPTSWHKFPDPEGEFWSDDRASFIIDYIQLYQKDGQMLNLK